MSCKAGDFACLVIHIGAIGYAKARLIESRVIVFEAVGLINNQVVPTDAAQDLCILQDQLVRCDDGLKLERPHICII